MEELILELKEKIIDALNLEEMTPDDIDADSPLFGEDSKRVDYYTSTYGVGYKGSH